MLEAATKARTLLEAKILALKGVTRKKSRWMDKDAFYIGRREFVHFHARNQIDVRLTVGYQRKYSGLIRGDRRIVFRGNPSEWIQVRFRTSDDVNFAFKIVRLASKANQNALRRS